ncbi:MAG: TlyA family RNA methyltransferase [Spirochaetales bacterium]|nr:TlyA family RNA methyltransferase [Spirochaetales bacterium]MCF7939312.1 TlyA family RNA methyltransferase [Spirochaetales bacterium]
MNSDQILTLAAAGRVCVDGERVRDPSQTVSDNGELRIIQEKAYVSRAGEKLEAALETFPVEIKQKVFVDAGSSTGGFTDCLLRYGAQKVHAVDVGYNLIDYRLRQDPRVILHERTGVMDLGFLEPPADAAVVDLSFRSLAGAVEHLLSLMREEWVIGLIKPQFEIPRDTPGFSGVVQDRDMRLEIVRGLLVRLEKAGVATRSLIASPLKGTSGNQEYLSLFVKHGSSGGPFVDPHDLELLIT